MHFPVTGIIRGWGLVARYLKVAVSCCLIRFMCNGVLFCDQWANKVKLFSIAGHRKCLNSVGSVHEPLSISKHNAPFAGDAKNLSYLSLKKELIQ